MALSWLTTYIGITNIFCVNEKLVIENVSLKLILNLFVVFLGNY